MHVADPKILYRIVMGNVYIFFFLSCLISSGLTKSIGPTLAYQDSLGQYSFGYSTPDSARSEIRTIDGETRGAYSYVDDVGVIHSAYYAANGKHGFRVVATNLPPILLPVKIAPDLITVPTAEIRPQEIAEGKQKTGEHNTFLQGLKPPEGKVVDLDKRIQFETKNATEVESQARSSGSANTKIPSRDEIFKMLKLYNVPLFRISQENLPIYPTVAGESINIQDPTITPESDILKSSEELPVPEEWQSKLQEEDKIIDSSQEIFTPLRILPLTSVYPSLLRHTSLPSDDFVAYKSS